MFKRVITFAGLPVVTGMLLFPVFWYLRVSELFFGRGEEGVDRCERQQQGRVSNSDTGSKHPAVGMAAGTLQAPWCAAC